MRSYAPPNPKPNPHHSPDLHHHRDHNHDEVVHAQRRRLAEVDAGPQLTRHAHIGDLVPGRSLVVG